MTMRQLGEKASVSASTICHMENEDSLSCTSFEAAERVADALGVPVHHIRWHHERSDRGRPVGTGTTLRLVRSKQHAEVCKTCFITLPATGICDDCS